MAAFSLNYISPMPILSFLLAAFTVNALASPSSNEGFINSGTPHGVTKSFDCTARAYAYEFGKELQGRHGTFVSLFDALQLEACNQTRPNKTDTKIPVYSPRLNKANANCIFYIDPIHGSNNNSGVTPALAFQTIEKGILESRQTRTGQDECVLNLMNGTYYQRSTLKLLDIDSFLTIQNYNGAKAVVSGGVPLRFGPDWELYKYKERQWQKYAGHSNIGGRATFNESNDLVIFLGVKPSYNACFEAVTNHNKPGNDEPRLYSFSWHSFAVLNQPWCGGCYGVRDISWQPTWNGLGMIDSARIEGLNVWRRKVSNFDEFGNKMPGLRINGKRAIRARYPDQDPERSMQFDPVSGWLPQDSGGQLQTWMDPIPTEPAQTVVVNAADYPSVDWPMTGPGGTTWTGEGDWGDFFQGMGGSCATDTLGGVDPPFGYWCSIVAPRQIIEHKCPSGCYLTQGAFPNAPYDNLEGIVVHAWKPNHWYTWAWDGGEYDRSTGGLQFERGGFQGGEGETKAWEWYIENVFEELNGGNEYFYNATEQYLYYYHNVSEEVAPADEWEFVTTYQNILWNITGTQEKPVQNVTIRGIEFRDTRYTYMDSHGLPSGGDWALARQGSIFIQGTEHVTIDRIVMTRLDATGIFINGYNRHAVIENSEFSYLGENAIAAWGYTSGLEEVLPGYGPDGRDGNQPRRTTIRNNLVHEIGIFQKQSSMWFQAQTCETRIENNIFFNGPRAAVNVNDGFGGGNWMIGNLLLNTCRESGDHGPWNSWDRVPYITRVRNGSASIVPAFNQIHKNFIIGTYQTSVGIDTDDGSSYLNTTENFFVYGDFGLKSDFSGHHHFHANNVYAYTNQWFLDWEAGANDRFVNNRFVTRQNEPNQCGYTSNCDLPPWTKGMEGYVYNNSIYTISGECEICGMSFKEWIDQGNDVGSTLDFVPDDQEIIQWAKEILA